MPSEKQRRMLLEPLLERRADLAYRNRFLFFRPVGHYWRAVYFWKTRGKVSLLSFVFPLFAGKFVSFIWGEGMAPDSNHLLQISWDDPERAALECSDFIERSILPCIADIVNPEELAKHPRYCNDMLDPLFRACFYGDFDEAERRAVGYVDWWGPTNSFYSEEKKMFVHDRARDRAPQAERRCSVAHGLPRAASPDQPSGSSDSVARMGTAHGEGVRN